MIFLFKEPGGLFYNNQYSSKLCDYPFQKWQVEDSEDKCTKSCTLVITCDSQNDALDFKKLKNYAAFPFVENIIIANCNNAINITIPNKRVVLMNKISV